MRLEFEPNVAAFPLIENEVFDDVSTLDSSDFQILMKNGISAALNGDREMARNLLFQAAEIDSCNEDVWMWLASISEYPEELLAFLDNVLDINPENERAIEWYAATRSLLAKTFVQRGIEAHEQADDELAMQCFEQALNNDGSCEMAWFWRASITDSNKEKIKCLKWVLQINPDNAEAQSIVHSYTLAAVRSALDNARSAAAAGDPDKAIGIIDEILCDHPDNIDALMLRSHFSVNLNEKLGSLEHVLEIDPENVMARSSFDFLSTTLEVAQPPTDELETESGMGSERSTAEFDLIGTEMSNDSSTDIDPLHTTEEPDEPEVVAVEADNTVTEITPEPQPAFEIESPRTEQIDEEFHMEDASELDSQVIEQVDQDTTDEPVAAVTSEQAASMVSDSVCCPFCSAETGSNAFECSSCKAVLSFSDIESLLSNSRPDHDIIQTAVTEIEAQWNLREFDESELTILALGQFNLGEFDRGLKYLQEASRLSPNDVILAGHVNTVAIRLEEIRHQAESQSSLPAGRSILVVDDSATVRKLISGKLEKSGHNVDCAVDGTEGLAKIAGSKPDLVLLDIGMPGMDGYEVCKEIRSNPETKDIPVVMISGKDGFFDKVRGKMAGATGYVTKPFGPETLMKALETYLAGETSNGQ